MKNMFSFGIGSLSLLLLFALMLVLLLVFDLVTMVDLFPKGVTCSEEKALTAPQEMSSVAMSRGNLSMLYQ